MNRTKYALIFAEFSKMRSRFETSPSVVLLWTGVLGFLFMGFYFVMQDRKEYADARMVTLVNIMGVILLISLSLSLAIYILFKGKKHCELWFSCYTFFQILATLVYIQSMFYVISSLDQNDLGTTINVISLLLIAMFMIICTILVFRKVKNGEYQQDAVKKPITKKVFIWGVLAIPFIPFGSSVVRRYGFNSLNDDWQALLFSYLLIWLWLVIIYSFLAKNLVFIILEIRNRLSNISKKESNIEH